MPKQSGFSFVELLTVVVIVAIVSTFAFNTYRSHVIDTNRTEARSALQSAAATLEKCRSIFGVYDHANCNYADFATESNVYFVTAALTANSFTLTATPVAGSVQAADLECTTLGVTNIGVKQATGSAVDDCW